MPITISKEEIDDYICITDIAAAKSDDSRAADVIKNWMRNRNTLEFIGAWEQIYNSNFKVVEFDHFRQQAGLHTFVLSASEWIEKTGAIGIFVKKGRYGGTYAHKDIAFELKSSNVRDYATINELTVLSNLETHNVQMIREGKSKEERFQILKEIVDYQMHILSVADKISCIEEKNEV